MRIMSINYIRIAASILMALTLWACNDASMPEVAAPQSAAITDGYAEEQRARQGESGEAQPEQQAGGAMLAYTYSMGVMAPKQTISPLVTAHQQACVDAGPSLCQVLGASTNSWGEDHVSANLNLRAEPEWLETFRGSIINDAEKSGGRLTSNTVYAEDLTQYITDVEARLAAKVALRDRIMKMLEEREGTLSDVLAAERALADVQGEIDSMTASLEGAKKRVSMSALSISYASDPETSTGVFKPLREAFGDFGRTSVASLAKAVNFVARAWPFFIVLLIVLAILRVWWRGRRRSAV